MREIILDTETTGFDPFTGDRIVEIGCVEVLNLVPTGENFHVYINPEREVPDSAVKVHGLKTEFLADKPKFEEVADALLEFIGDAAVVAHNAQFDMRFINWELEYVSRTPLPGARVVDTLAIARQKFPGAQNSLDALCRRFNINNSHRQLHGALLDAEILAEVYLELRGGRQAGLELDSRSAANSTGPGAGARDRKSWPQRGFAPSAEELERHAQFIESLKDPVWRRQ